MQAGRWPPFHVQLELNKREEMPRTPGKRRLQGRVFRTDGRLAVGDEIAFSLWVCRKGDEPTGQAYIYDADLN